MEQKHSRIGIASIIISSAIVFVSLAFFVLAKTGLIGSEMEEVARNEVVRLWIIVVFVINILTLGLGIGGLFVKKKRKISAIIGTSLSVINIIGVITFLSLYYKHHQHGYIGIEKVFFAKPDPFISFINRFAQEPFLLQEKEEYYVSTLSKAELRILRNTILARRGYIFDSKDLNAFFNARKWYVPLSKNIELVEMDRNDEKIDRKNESLILTFEEPEKIRFDDFLKLFRHADLPIDITSNKYGATYSKRIPIYFTNKFIKNSGYLDLQAIDMVYSNNRFIAVLYGIHWAGVKIVLKTYTPEGSEIADVLVAAYGGDLSGFTTTTAQIDKNLNVNAEIKHYSREYDNDSKKTETKLKNTKSEKYVIDQKGEIKKF